jgi:hypothetical protein
VNGQKEWGNFFLFSVFVWLKTSLWHTIRHKRRFIYMDEVLYLSFWRDSRDWREQNHENKADKCFRLVRFMDDEI